MTVPESQVTVEERPGLTLVTFRRDVFDPLQLEHLRIELLALVQNAEAPRLVLNLGKLRHAPSVFLGVLLDLSVKAARKNGVLAVTSMTPQIADLFALTRLDKFARVFATDDEAIAALEQGKSL